MLSLPPTVRIWLAAQPADLRKSFDGLAALVREGLQGDPLSGDVFVFRNKAGDRVKLLLWEEDGYAIWYKRLEAGTFRFPTPADAQPRAQIRAADFVMLLAGVDLASVKRGKRYHRPVPQPTV
jgi:transposase